MDCPAQKILRTMFSGFSAAQDRPIEGDMIITTNRDWVISVCLSLSLSLSGVCVYLCACVSLGRSPLWILSELRIMEAVVTTGARRRAKLQSNRHHQHTPSPSFLQPRCPSCHPSNSVRALKGKMEWAWWWCIDWQVLTCRVAGSCQSRQRPTCW